MNQDNLSHEDALNLLLSHACGYFDKDTVEKHGGFQEYSVELHCSSFTVEAKHLGDGKYQVRSVKQE